MGRAYWIAGVGCFAACTVGGSPDEVVAIWVEYSADQEALSPVNTSDLQDLLQPGQYLKINQSSPLIMESNGEPALEECLRSS